MTSEKELQRRTLRLLNKCLHFNGIQNVRCKAGVNYQDLVGDKWKNPLPCFADQNSDVTCASLCWRTPEGTRKEVEEKDARVRVFLNELEKSICPICKVEVKQRQVGSCVYGTCGHRLYQGKVNPAYAV